MAPETEKKEEVLYRADPLTFIFRELDLMHNEIREFKSDTKEEFASVNKRLDSFMSDTSNRFEGINKRFDDVNRRIDGFMLDVNSRFDSLNNSINKRFDKLYIIVILNLLGIAAFLIKEFFF
jgi:tetrahydromethanopterin S-methyltransferase subunit G